MPEPPVAVLASRVRAEEKQILAALDRHRVPYEHVDTRRLSAAIPPRLPYRAALAREISHTRALYAAKLLESAQVPTLNTAAVIELCGDKLLASLALSHAGLPVPRTAVALNTAGALEAMERFGYPVVVKPLAGSWGRLAAVVRDQETAQALLEHRAALPSPQQHVVYIQELIDKPGRDIRLIVVGERVLGASYRESAQWRTNVARGARSVRCPLPPGLERLALAAARAVGGGVLGVDVLEDGHGGLYVLEINHTVEFTGFQEAHGGEIDVADAIVSHLRQLVAA